MSRKTLILIYSVKDPERKLPMDWIECTSKDYERKILAYAETLKDASGRFATEPGKVPIQTVERGLESGPNNALGTFANLLAGLHTR
jgi:hypothetical protein